MDNKPLLQDKPPAYNTIPGAYEYGGPPQNYGAIPASAPPPPAGFQQPPPPYPYPAGQGKSTFTSVETKPGVQKCNYSHCTK